METKTVKKKAKKKKATLDDLVKKSTNRRKKYLYEIGLFVVEFEKLQKEVKKYIGECFSKEELSDVNLIQIILYRTQSMELTEYFRGIALYQLAKLETQYSSLVWVVDKKTKEVKQEIKYHTEEDRKKFKDIRKLIAIANENLAEAATFRNDLLHATYDDTTEFYFKDKKLKFMTKFQGARSKIRGQGIEQSYIFIEPKVFDKVIEMMRMLSFLIGHISSILNDDKFYTTANLSEDHFKVYDEIKIKTERTRLFESSSDHYLKQFLYERNRKGAEEYATLFPDGNIPG